MNEALSFRKNHADMEVLVIHLNRCDKLFVPQLSERVNIEAYAKKILANAMRFEAWHEQVLIGLVAAYCNDPEKQSAYITSVSLLPEWQGQGVATRLLDDCVRHFRVTGFDELELEVDQGNLAAIALYQKFGFEPTCYFGSSVLMTIK